MHLPPTHSFSPLCPRLEAFSPILSYFHCIDVLDTLFCPYQMSAELVWAFLSPTQTLQRWNRFSWRCVRAWGGPWWWPAGCCEPTPPVCCDLSGFYQTGCSTPEPLMPKEMRRSIPSAAWIETAGGSTPVMSSMRLEQANAPSRLQVKICLLQFSYQLTVC